MQTLLILLALASSVTNPLIEQRADPHVYRDVSGTYYLTATVPEYDRIVLRASKTIAGLAQAPERVIWRKHASGPMAAHIWAPEIHRIEGRWYVYFTAGRSDDIWAIRLYVLENESADPMQGEWREKGQLKTEFESFSLDATTFEHRGQRYLLWTQRPLEPKGAGTDIYIARMKNPWTIEGPQVSISSPTLEWETRGYQGQRSARGDRAQRPRVRHLFGERHGRELLRGSAERGRRCRARQRGELDEIPVPVFRSSDRNGQYGPGHNSFTVAEDGKTDLFVYHARNYARIEGDPLHDPNRHTRVQPLTWNADGTPGFGEPVADGPLKLTP